MDGEDTSWFAGAASDAAPTVWPARWSITGAAGAWAWGETADPGATVDAHLVPFDGAEPIAIAILGLFDPIDGLFAVRVMPSSSSIFIEHVWERLRTAALALGEVATVDLGLVEVETDGSRVTIDALDRHIEFHPSAD